MKAAAPGAHTGALSLYVPPSRAPRAPPYAYSHEDRVEARGGEERGGQQVAGVGGDEG